MEWYEKFKVNQEVRVVKKVITWGLPKYGRGASWPLEMDKTLGKIYKIIDVDIYIGYRLNTDPEHGYNYWFPIESLDCVNVKGEQLVFDFMR